MSTTRLVTEIQNINIYSTCLQPGWLQKYRIYNTQYMSTTRLVTEIQNINIYSTCLQPGWLQKYRILIYTVHVYNLAGYRNTEY